MRNLFLTACLLFASFVTFAQAGHVMQGIGAVNMSMGGAATAQPLDINGALYWNPATLSNFEGKILSISAGAFFSSPTLKSSFGPLNGVTEDDRGMSIMPAIAFVWGKADSKHTFGVSAFGISGFGVTFPENTNYPQDMMGNMNPDYDPSGNSNPINFPQFAGGFGHLESDYMLLQVGLTYSYEITDHFSIGLQPTINYAALELAPNPLASPSFPPPMGEGKGYPTADKASAIGYGGQVGIFYDSGEILKLGASYKSKQYFGEFDFDQKYLDGSEAPNVQFTMNYPAIYSVGMGLSGKRIDFALDFRYVDYEGTEGFAEKGWQMAYNEDFGQNVPTGAVNGFGWKNMSILSVGLQYKVTDKIPVRLGYTYSSTPIEDDLAFFSIPATAVINDAAQFGLGYVGGNFEVNAVYHFGFRGDGVSGNMLSPAAITPDNPLGSVPGTSVSYDMETSMIQLSFNYTFGGGSTKTEVPAE